MHSRRRPWRTTPRPVPFSGHRPPGSTQAGQATGSRSFAKSGPVSAPACDPDGILNVSMRRLGAHLNSRRDPAVDEVAAEIHVPRQRYGPAHPGGALRLRT